MKFMTVWSIVQSDILSTRERFKDPEPLDGIKLVGRWHECATGKGFTLVETDDMVALSRYANYWADLVDMKIVPVIDDEEVAKVLSG